MQQSSFLSRSALFMVLLAVLPSLGDAQIVARTRRLNQTAPPACGKAWRRVSSPSPSHQSGDANQLSAIGATSSTDAWAVGWTLSFGGGGYKTLTEHWDGTRWTVIPSANTSMRNNYLIGVSALAPNDVWAVGQQDDNSGNMLTLVEHWDGTSWTVDPQASTPGSLGDVVAFSPNDVWAGGFVLEHWDGTTWSVTQLGSARYLGVLAGDSSSLWAVGYRLIQPIGPVLTLSDHFDGVGWTPFKGIDPLRTSADDEDVLTGVDSEPGGSHPFAVGYFANFDANPPAHTLVERWDGQQWRLIPAVNPGGPHLDNELWDVEVLSQSNVWIVGTVGSDGSSDNQALIEHWNGSSWTAAPNLGTGVLVGIGGDRPTGNLWAVGYTAAGNYQATMILAACGL